MYEQGPTLQEGGIDALRQRQLLRTLSAMVVHPHPNTAPILTAPPW